MDLKWSPKGALKLGGIVLLAIPKRSHKTALIFSPFWTPPGPKMEPNGSQSDSKTSQSSTSKRSQKSKHNNIQQTSTTPASGVSKALRRKQSVRASVYTSRLCSTKTGGLCKTPTSANFQNIPTALEILRHFGRRTQGTRQKHDGTSTRHRQGLAKTRTARKKSGAAVLPPKGGFQLNNCRINSQNMCYHRGLPLRRR